MHSCGFSPLSTLLTGLCPPTNAVVGNSQGWLVPTAYLRSMPLTLRLAFQSDWLQASSAKLFLAIRHLRQRLIGETKGESGLRRAKDPPGTKLLYPCQRRNDRPSTLISITQAVSDRWTRLHCQSQCVQSVVKMSHGRFLDKHWSYQAHTPETESIPLHPLVTNGTWRHNDARIHSRSWQSSAKSMDPTSFPGQKASPGVISKSKSKGIEAC